MGMGYSAHHAIRMKTELIERLAPGEMARLKLLLSASNLTMRDFADYVCETWDFDEGDEAVMETALELYTEITIKVREETGLEPYLNVHNSASNGDRYDDVDGEYWEVDFSQIFTRTPAGEKWKEELEEIRFVSYG